MKKQVFAAVAAAVAVGVAVPVLAGTRTGPTLVGGSTQSSVTTPEADGIRSTGSMPATTVSTLAPLPGDSVPFDDDLNDDDTYDEYPDDQYDDDSDDRYHDDSDDQYDDQYDDDSDDEHDDDSDDEHDDDSDDLHDDD